MVSREATIFTETPPPTRTADHITAEHQTTYALPEHDPLAPVEPKYHTARQIIALLDARTDNQQSQTPPRELVDLTLQFGSQLTLEEPGTAESLHPPTVRDVEFLFECRDAARQVLDTEALGQNSTPQEVRAAQRKAVFLDNLVFESITAIEGGDSVRVAAMLRAANATEDEAFSSITEYYRSLLPESPAPQNDRFFPLSAFYPTPKSKLDTKLIKHINLDIDAAVTLARQLSPASPEVADSALAGLAEQSLDTPRKSIEISGYINSPVTKAIRLSDALRAGRATLDSNEIIATQHMINTLFEDVVNNPNPRQRVFTMAEIAANIGDPATIAGVKEYITYISSQEHDMQNLPVAALFAAIDMTNQPVFNPYQRRGETPGVYSFQDAIRIEFSRLHAEDDRIREASLKAKIAPIPREFAPDATAAMAHIAFKSAI